MTESRSTDKLLALSHIMDKLMDKLPPEKVEKIKTLRIEWKNLNQSGTADLPLPELVLEFHP